ncbi:MAG TPA: hypothetical protein PKG51_09845, partial [Arachnia sp.]|nr:hypothetical protein [Arachnia sp.]
LVISTFPVTVGKPTAVIRSVPTKRDFEAIEEKLAQAAQGIVLPMRGAARSMPELGSSYPGLVSLGVTLNRDLVDAAEQPLAPSAAEGLLLHCLLLAERLASGRQYQAAAPVGAGNAALRGRLLDVFAARQLRIQESELQAILAYFDLKEET